jgi:hypothetical protein
MLLACLAKMTELAPTILSQGYIRIVANTFSSCAETHHYRLGRDEVNCMTVVQVTFPFSGLRNIVCFVSYSYRPVRLTLKQQNKSKPSPKVRLPSVSRAHRTIRTQSVFTVLAGAGRGVSTI